MEGKNGSNQALLCGSRCVSEGVPLGAPLLLCRPFVMNASLCLSDLLFSVHTLGAVKI